MSMDMDRERARQLAAGVAWARIGLGVSAILTPSLPLRPWVGGAAAWRPQAKLLARGLGARDIALGLGVVLALRQGGPVRGWVEASVLADAGDVLATLLAFGSLPKLGRLAVLASAGGAAAVGGMLAPAVD